MFFWRGRQRVRTQVLRAIATVPMPGVLIGKAIGIGVGRLYPVFHDLEQEGLLESWVDSQPRSERDGARRTFYGLTNAGRDRLRRQIGSTALYTRSPHEVSHPLDWRDCTEELPPEAMEVLAGFRNGAIYIASRIPYESPLEPGQRVICWTTDTGKEIMPDFWMPLPEIPQERSQ